jgi:hypothetical protein
MSWNKTLRFLYLNIYSFLVTVAGILVLLLPFYKLTLWTLVGQIPVALYLFKVSFDLFSTYEDKIKKVDILTGKNKKEFRADTFKVFMQAPCSRLIVRYTLNQINKKNEYKHLLKMKKSFVENVREGCTPVDTVIYINEETV